MNYRCTATSGAQAGKLAQRPGPSDPSSGTKPKADMTVAVPHINANKAGPLVSQPCRLLASSQAEEALPSSAATSVAACRSMVCTTATSSLKDVRTENSTALSMLACSLLCSSPASTWGRILQHEAELGCEGSHQGSRASSSVDAESAPGTLPIQSLWHSAAT